MIKKRRERENGAAPCRVALNSDRENIEQREKKEQEREREAFHAFDGAQKGNAEHEMPFVSEKCQMFMYTFTAHKSKPFRALITIKLNCKKTNKILFKEVGIHFVFKTRRILHSNGSNLHFLKIKLVKIRYNNS